jgi:hypothetical protein
MKRIAQDACIQARNWCPAKLPADAAERVRDGVSHQVRFAALPFG